MIYAGVLWFPLYIAMYLAGVLSSWPQNPSAAQRLLIVVLKTPANNINILEDSSIVDKTDRGRIDERDSEVDNDI